MDKTFNQGLAEIAKLCKYFEIKRLVYQLNGLTAEEIAIVKGER